MNFTFWAGELFCNGASFGTVKSMDVDVAEEKYEVNKTYHLNGSMSGEISFDVDNNLDINEVFGIDMSKIPDEYIIRYTKLVQAKTHKKRRINKKWLKRYGVKPILVTSKGWEVNTYTDGTFEFIKENNA